MGIVKAASGVATVKNGNTSGNEDLMREERLLLQSSPSQESDDCEQAEVDCELAMSGGQVCNVPYGLYDLPELNGILSLETWNLCLMEDDRFRLAAYLPDMDQHDLFTTLTELFSGSAMFFGNPLRGFFHRLSGGFYSPDVSQARELRMNFQRRRHYHFLKLYHDVMVWKFTFMKNLLRSGMSTSLEEKIHIWHNWIHEKPLTVTDPSSSPMNASLSIIGEAESASSSLMKRAKLMEGISATDCSAKHEEIVHRPKSMETSSSKNHIFHTAGLIPLNHLGMQVSTFSPYASSQHVHNIAVNPSYPYYMNTNRSSLGSSSSNPLQWEGALETYPVLVKGPSGIQHTILEELKRGNHSAMLRGYQSAPKPSLAYSMEANYISESLHEKNLLMNFGQQSASDLRTRTTVGYQMNGWTNMPNPRNVEMPTLGGSAIPSYNNFSEHSETIWRYHDGPKMKAPPAMNSVTKAEEDRFPCTYSRRKLHRGVDLVDPIKTPTMLGSESSTVLASMANVKAKAIQL